MKVFLLLLAMLVLSSVWTASIGQTPATLPSEAEGQGNQEPSDADALDSGGPEAKRYTRQDVPGSVLGREVAEVSIEEIRPPFTAETVARLNEIVRRSMVTASAYTRSIRAIRTAVEAAGAGTATSEQEAEAAAGLAKLRTWREQSMAARAAIDAATADLQSGEESFSRELLAGMRKYVYDVAEAIGEDLATAEGKLAS